MDKFLSLMDDFIEKEKIDFAIKELENLKADMGELCPDTCKNCKGCPFNDLHFFAKSGCRLEDFIDKHIAELKGETE